MKITDFVEESQKRTRMDIFLDKMSSIAVGNSLFSEETQKTLLTKIVGPVTLIDLIMFLVTIIVLVFSKGF